MPARVGVEAQELGGVRLAEHARLPRAGQDLRVAGDRADRPGGQQVAHPREVPVGDGLDARHPQAGLGQQRPDGPRGAGAARHHVLDDDGLATRARLALGERAAGLAGLGAHVGEREVEPLGHGLRPRDARVRHRHDVVGAGKRRAGGVGERVIDEAAQGRDRVEAAAVAAAGGPDPGFPAVPLVPGHAQVGGEGAGCHQRGGHGAGVPRVGQAGRRPAFRRLRNGRARRAGHYTDGQAACGLPVRALSSARTRVWLGA